METEITISYSYLDNFFSFISLPMQKYYWQIQLLSSSSFYSTFFTQCLSRKKKKKKKKKIIHTSPATIPVWHDLCLTWLHSKSLQQKVNLHNLLKANLSIHNSYLTIIPLALMGSESIAHEALGLMGYWLRAHEGERNNCFSKIQLVGQKISRQNIFR